MSASDGPVLSVVIATYERPLLLERLLRQLAAQSLPPAAFEVIVVDDGSRIPVAGLVAKLQLPYPVRVLRQVNGGAASARHAGVLTARGAVVLITDDDMQVSEGFLAAHLRHHGKGRKIAVIGEIRPDPAIASLPLFERFHADSLQRQARARDEGRAQLHGTNLYTGNTSFRRDDYLAIGGFDVSLERSEDADLGLRLEQSGVELIYDREGFVLHGSDHTDLPQWLGRAYRYGRYDQRIADKHPALPYADPWRYLFTQAVIKRPLLAVIVLAPVLGQLGAAMAMQAGETLAAFGFETAALRAAGLAFDLQYVRGLRDEAGSLAEAMRRVRSYRQKARMG